MCRHGIRQLQTGWADGPAYVTQCPIQSGQSYVYNYTIVGQRGTLFWHAHISWLRSTVYGPIVILPKLGVPYPFPKPHKELPPIIFGTNEPFFTITQQLEDSYFFNIFIYYYCRRVVECRHGGRHRSGHSVRRRPKCL